jgi:hypothetical protein
MYACAYVRMYVCTYVYVYRRICMYACAYVRMYVRILDVRMYEGTYVRIPHQRANHGLMACTILLPFLMISLISVESFAEAVTCSSVNVCMYVCTLSLYLYLARSLSNNKRTKCMCDLLVREPLVRQVLLLECDQDAVVLVALRDERRQLRLELVTLGVDVVLGPVDGGL